MSTNRIATASCALGMLTYVGLMSVFSTPQAVVEGIQENTIAPESSVSVTTDLPAQSVLQPTASITSD